MRALYALLLLSLGAVFAWSAVAPYDRFTWWLEVAPVIIGLVAVLATGRRFPLTPLVYVLLWFHAIVLLVGGHYTYARVPLFDWIREYLNLDRNHFDRLGHFMQGFVPAIVAREVLVRLSPLRPGRWLAFLVVCFCLALSATYELVEWVTAVWTGSKAEAFLGTQGDVWDTQWDMFLCLCGAIVSLSIWSRLHDRQLRRLAPPETLDGCAKAG